LTVALGFSAALLGFSPVEALIRTLIPMVPVRDFTAEREAPVRKKLEEIMKSSSREDRPMAFARFVRQLSNGKIVAGAVSTAQELPQLVIDHKRIDVDAADAVPKIMDAIRDVLRSRRDIGGVRSELREEGEDPFQWMVDNQLPPRSFFRAPDQRHPSIRIDRRTERVSKAKPKVEKPAAEKPPVNVQERETEILRDTLVRMDIANRLQAMWREGYLVYPKFLQRTMYEGTTSLWSKGMRVFGSPKRMYDAARIPVGARDFGTTRPGTITEPG